MLISDRHKQAMIGLTVRLIGSDDEQIRREFAIDGPMVMLPNAVHLEVGPTVEDIPAVRVPKADEVMVVEISEISAYADELYGSPGNHVSDLTADYPSVISPWPYAIFEYKQRDENGQAGYYMAAAILTKKIESGFRQLISFFASFDKADEKLPSPIFAVECTADAEGKFTSGRSLGRVDVECDLNGQAHFMLAAPLLAISFLHCKNVTTTDHSTPPKLARKREARNQPVGVSYKTLDIFPMRQVIRRSLADSPTDEKMKRALHICRGNFARYTEDRPLFGRVVGTVWRPAHVKGGDKTRQIQKDIRIRRPNVNTDKRSAGR